MTCGRVCRVCLFVLVSAIGCLLALLASFDPEIPLISKVGGLGLWVALMASGVPHTFHRPTFESIVPRRAPGEHGGVASFDLAFTLSDADPLITPFRMFVPLTNNSTAPLNYALFIHGGGYFLLHADDAAQDEFCRDLARSTNSIVLSLEYRLAPEHPFPASLDDAKRFMQWAIDASRPAPFLCRTELRLCADDLIAQADRRTLLRTQHPLAMNVARDFFVQLGSSAGANLVLAAALSIEAKEARGVHMRCAHTELMAPYLGVTEDEAKARRDWILHEELLVFAVKMLGEHLQQAFMDPVLHNVDLGDFDSVGISAGRKEIGLASMQRLCDAFTRHKTPCEFRTYDAVHGFVASGRLGGQPAIQARQDVFVAMNKALVARRAK
jgi:acetyl esterase/lipase